MKLPYDPKFYFTTKDVASELGLSKDTTNRVVKRAKLTPISKLNNLRLYSRNEFSKITDELNRRRSFKKVIYVDREVQVHWLLAESKLNFM